MRSVGIVSLPYAIVLALVTKVEHCQSYIQDIANGIGLITRRSYLIEVQVTRYRVSSASPEISDRSW